MNKAFINRIRERINLRLFTHKTLVLRSLRIASLLVSLVTLASILYYYGYPKTSEATSIVSTIITISIGFYIFKFLTHIFYDFHPGRYIRENLTEALILLFILLIALLYQIFNIPIINFVSKSLGFDIRPYALLFVQLYFFIIVGLETGKASHKLRLFELGPSTLMTLSFIILISAGTVLLLLPEMTHSGIRFLDALFTSTSASCVTGLTVVNTANHFTLKGQIVIMILFQLGGINIVSFATFFASFYRSDSVRYQSIMKDFLSTDRLSDTRILLRRIVFFSLIIEIAGTILIFLTWNDQVAFTGSAQQVYFSLFHSISAFNNAGFSLFPGGLTEQWVAQSYSLHMCIALLIFLGGIGFVTLEEFYELLTHWKKLIHPWKNLSVASRLVLMTSLSLILAGALVFIYAHWDLTLSGMDVRDLAVTSIFHSVSARTAGFNTVDVATFAQPVLIFFIFLMYVGGSPGGTSGGIKTTTLAIIIKSAFATIRGKRNVEAYHHTIAFSLIDKAYTIALFALFLIFFSVFLLSFTEPDVRFMHLVFEEVSAFATVGLSTGITPLLSDAGKTIILISMFIGRIGPLTLALFLSRPIISTHYRYPEIRVMVG
ncbi:MAG TPA: potassium transporter TrkG [Bacteroidales bacterium]|nr:potassium transporter TrkG [Bacteroidales bacterium]HNS46073.1 potassium transporter TrkG [Bacteroidales bacterium]